MSRTLVGRRTVESPAGDRHTILHYVRIADAPDGRGVKVVRRVDLFETDGGHPVVFGPHGRFNAFIGGRWVDLVECASQ